MRKVRTAEGARFYGQPIGTPITPNIREAAKAKNGGKLPPKGATSHGRSITKEPVPNVPGANGQRPGAAPAPAAAPAAPAASSASSAPAAGSLKSLKPAAPTLEGPKKFNVGGAEFSAPEGSRVFKSKKGIGYVTTPDGDLHAFTESGQVSMDPPTQARLKGLLARTPGHVSEDKGSSTSDFEAAAAPTDDSKKNSSDEPADKVADKPAEFDPDKAYDTGRDLARDLEASTPGLKLSIMDKYAGHKELSNISVDKDKRGGGIADATMDKIVDIADKNGWTFTLTPSDSFGSSKTKLKAWYKRHGFIENKGRNRDFTISDDMYRLPKEKPAPKAAPKSAPASKAPKEKAPEPFSGVETVKASATGKKVGPATIKPLAPKAQKMFEAHTKEGQFFADPEVQEASRKALKDIVDRQRVAIRMTPEAVEMLLTDGKYKTQHETGTSGGMVAGDHRKDQEALMFDDASGAPIYGYMSGGIGDDEDSTTRLNRYGKVRIVLKDSAVRDRTSVTVADSLVAQTQPSPLNDPSFTSLPLDEMRLSDTAKKNPEKGVSAFLKGWQKKVYIEAQIHGGVSLSDIERIEYPEGSVNYDGQPELMAKLKAAGVNYGVYDDSKGAKVGMYSKKEFGPNGGLVEDPNASKTIEAMLARLKKANATGSN